MKRVSGSWRRFCLSHFYHRKSLFAVKRNYRFLFGQNSLVDDAIERITGRRIAIDEARRPVIIGNHVADCRPGTFERLCPFHRVAQVSESGEVELERAW